MRKKNSAKASVVWTATIILFVCVAATTIAFMGRMNLFLLDDSGAIPLIQETPLPSTQSGVSFGESFADISIADESVGKIESSEESQKTDESEAGSNVEVGEVSKSEVSKKPFNPSFQVGDDNTIWSTETKVEIFRISYENGEHIITVRSDDGDKVIAPGTENSYTFKLKNTGNVALDYSVEVDAFFTPEDTPIPISGRLQCYDGTWVVGNKDEFASVPELNLAEDSATLGAGNYTYYTLDWVWPFESGNDELDTMLGNIAVEEDLIFTIVITTIASASDDTSNDSGIEPPNTGENSNLLVWILLIACSAIMILYVMSERQGGNRRYDAEAEEI